MAGRWKWPYHEMIIMTHGLTEMICHRVSLTVTHGQVCHSSTALQSGLYYLAGLVAGSQWSWSLPEAATCPGRARDKLPPCNIRYYLWIYNIHISIIIFPTAKIITQMIEEASMMIRHAYIDCKVAGHMCMQALLGLCMLFIASNMLRQMQPL